jgi:hypothetical protein
MTDPEDKKKPERWSTVTKNRLIIWVLVGGFALYMIGSGVVGMLTK